MAETYPNPFYGASPIGDALKNLAATVMTGPTEAQRILQAETALRAQTQRLGTQSIADTVAQFGQPGYDRNAAMRSAVLAGYDPKHLAELERYGASNTYGVNDPRTSSAFVGAGGSFENSPQGAREKDALKLYEFNNKPQVYGTDQGPVIGTVATAIGRPAVEPLTNVQGNAARVAMNSPGGIPAQPPAMQRFIHANDDPKITHNYVAPGGAVIQTRDGITDARTGAPLPQGGYIASPQGDVTGLGITTGTKTKLQEQDIALQKLKTIGDYSQQFITPQTVGLPGAIQNVTQNVAATVANVAKGLGATSPQEWLDQARARAAAGGMDKGTLDRLFTFDPNIPKLETAYHMLVLSGAEALAGGMGRASDRDVNIIRHMFGSPENLFASPESLKAKMGAISDLIGIQRGNIQTNMPRPQTAPQPAAPAAAGVTAQPPSPPPAAPQQPQILRYNPATGQLE